MTEVRCWRDLAACRDVVSADYDPFFADAKDLQAEAIAICATCPVRDACLTFAVRTGQQYGIWGGQPQQIIRRLIALERAGRPPRPPGARQVIPRPARPTANAAIASTAANTYYAPDGQRRCRSCLRDAQPTRAQRRRRGGNTDVA